MERRSFLALGMGPLAAQSLAAAGDESLPGKLPPPLESKDFFAVKIEEFRCDRCDPVTALDQLCQEVLRIIGKLLRVKIQERHNPQDLQERIGRHRLLSRDFKGSTAWDIFTNIIAGSLWHWEKSDDGGILVKAWHKPNIDD